MDRNEKAELASVLKEKFQKATVALFADYKGLSAPQADALRRQLRSLQTEVKVLKNNVARLAAKDGSLGNDAKALMDDTVGPTLVAFAYGDPAAAAKVVHKFAQDNEAFTIKDSLMGDKRIDVSGVEELAKLPSKEVLLAMLLGTLNAPVTNFVGVLAAVPRSLVTVLAAIEKKKANPQA
ncbi:MAG TPA: 50S ribosomal protein L10 [Bdellovibrionales bacterium]|nr:MAG: 50S ribosomal protein L10 [Bdellovibrionales bacterium GWA1_52_35]HAR41754.1 50S ribosomal protein L10 [Bdellovibrionales bacterium]HCM41191.1 50S ribosomal protein L10 [Bdellovibrionales bacterium]